MVRGRAGRLAAAVVVAAWLVFGAGSAVAAPKGIFSIFSGCPLGELEQLGANPDTSLCFYGQITSGQMAIGGLRVPFARTITLEGGFAQTGNPENEREFFMVPNPGGQTLAGAELAIRPDMLDCAGITGSGKMEKEDRLVCGLNPGLQVALEVVTSAKHRAIFNLFSLARREGVALTLPVRLHLKGALLGAACYIGSEADPIEWHLTDGRTDPEPPAEAISGKLGQLETLEEPKLVMLRVPNELLVDNTFSVPAAQGCGEASLSAFVGQLIDAELRLPSKDGHSSIVMSGTLNVAVSGEAVESSERLPEA
ncbi:MAG TPA: hypothetical protein VNV42_00485 [Solirubrobacteraceae bacterium]|jgi:hypothetical protein|nr:hypothetical protein [Solirubrobacteraceae bacterium]